MTTPLHIEPALLESNVVTLDRYLEAESRQRRAESGSALDPEAAGFIQGIDAARRALSLMWRASVVAAKASACGIDWEVQ